MQRVSSIHPSSAYISQPLYATLINQSVPPIISTLPSELPEVWEQQTASSLVLHETGAKQKKEEEEEEGIKTLFRIDWENKQMHKSPGLKRDFQNILQHITAGMLLAPCEARGVFSNRGIVRIRQGFEEAG